MNNFLNLYAQKLSLAGPEEDASPEKRIQIDCDDYEQIRREVDAEAYNPYVQAEKLKQQIRMTQEQAAYLAKMRGGNNQSQVAKNAKKAEEKEFIRQLKKVIWAQIPDPAKTKHKYRKGISTNKFSKYRQVMEQLHERNFMSDQKDKKAHTKSCNRVSCENRASTFYMTPMKDTSMQF